jgi:hypothetical protein
MIFWELWVSAKRRGCKFISDFSIGDRVHLHTHGRISQKIDTFIVSSTDITSASAVSRIPVYDVVVLQRFSFKIVLSRRLSILWLP